MPCCIFSVSSLPKLKTDKFVKEIKKDKSWLEKLLFQITNFFRKCELGNSLKNFVLASRLSLLKISLKLEHCLKSKLVILLKGQFSVSRFTKPSKHNPPSKFLFSIYN